MLSYPQDPIVEELLNRIKARSDEGMKTYGQPLTRADLSPAFWHNAATEEMIDFLLYFLRLRRSREDAETFLKERLTNSSEWYDGARFDYYEPEDVHALLDFIYGAKK